MEDRNSFAQVFQKLVNMYKIFSSGRKYCVVCFSTDEELKLRPVRNLLDFLKNHAHDIFLKLKLEKMDVCYICEYYLIRLSQILQHLNLTSQFSTFFASIGQKQDIYEIFSCNDPNAPVLKKVMELHPIRRTAILEMCVSSKSTNELCKLSVANVVQIDSNTNTIIEKPYKLVADKPEKGSRKQWGAIETSIDDDCQLIENNSETVIVSDDDEPADRHEPKRPKRKRGRPRAKMAASPLPPRAPDTCVITVDGTGQSFLLDVQSIDRVIETTDDYSRLIMPNPMTNSIDNTVEFTIDNAPLQLPPLVPCPRQKAVKLNAKDIKKKKPDTVGNKIFGPRKNQEEPTSAPIIDNVHTITNDRAIDNSGAKDIDWEVRIPTEVITFADNRKISGLR